MALVENNNVIQALSSNAANNALDLLGHSIRFLPAPHHQGRESRTLTNFTAIEAFKRYVTPQILGTEHDVEAA